MLFKNKKLIGLDIGTSSIKLAEMEVSRRSATLISFGFAPTPAGAVGSGEITDIAALSQVIKNLAAEVKTRRRYVAIGLWGTAVIVKKITIPKIDTNLLSEQIRWEAEQYIPFDINEISLAYHVLKQGGSADTMDILLIAAQNELVMQYAETIEGAGLSSSVMDVSGFALANSFEMNYGGENNCVALLNIGAGITNFVVVNKGEIVFSRDVPTGGQSFTNEIHKEMGITLGEAEALKISAVAGREVPDEIHSIIAATTETVCEEVNNSFEFFAATSNGLAISKCYYSGGGSAMVALIEQLSRTVSLPFEKFDPFLRLKFDGKSFSPSYLEQIKPFAGVVTGLALRQVGDK